MGVIVPSGSNYNSPYSGNDSGFGAVVGGVIVIGGMILLFANIGAVFSFLGTILWYGLWLLGALFFAMGAAIACIWVVSGFSTSQDSDAPAAAFGAGIMVIGILVVAVARFVFGASIPLYVFLWSVAIAMSITLLLGLTSRKTTEKARIFSVLFTILLIAGMSRLYEHQPAFLLTVWDGPRGGSDGDGDGEDVESRATLVFDIRLQDVGTGRDLTGFAIDIRAKAHGETVSRNGPGKITIEVPVSPDGRVTVHFGSPAVAFYAPIDEDVVVEGVVPGGTHEREVILRLRSR